MKIEVKYNIDFSKALKELKKDKLTRVINLNLGREIAQLAKRRIRNGLIKPKLSKNNPRGVKAKPLYDTGTLAKSLKGTPQGIKGVNYAKEHREGYQYERGDVPAREFVTAVLPSEKTSTNKIYKEFEKKFVKLLSKSIRKR